MVKCIIKNTPDEDQEPVAELSLKMDGNDVDLCINGVPVLWFDAEEMSIETYRLEQVDINKLEGLINLDTSKEAICVGV